MPPLRLVARRSRIGFDDGAFGPAQQCAQRLDAAAAQRDGAKAYETSSCTSAAGLQAVETAPTP
jgi:hypothetical protein